MEPAFYENALVAASDEIQELLKKRAEIDERLNQLKTTVNALAAILTPSPRPHNSYEWDTAVARMELGSLPDITDAGISDAIRRVLVDARTPLTPTEIRDALITRGIELSQYANPLSVIHNTLKRLTRQGELTAIVALHGQITSYAVNQRSPTTKNPSDRMHQLLRAQALEIDSEKLPDKIRDAIHGPRKSTIPPPPGMKNEEEK